MWQHGTPPEIPAPLAPIQLLAPLLEFQRVTVRYGATTALSELTLSVSAGEIVAVVGANGAGKSTLLRVACGEAPTSGRVVRLGSDARSLTAETAGALGVLLEDAPAWPELLVYDALVLSGRLHGLAGERLVERVRETLDACGLAHVASVPVHTLSRGYRQRLGWATALLHRPKLLVFDEPTTGLDDGQEEAVWHLLEAARARGVGALLSTHSLDRLGRVDRAIALHAGRLVASLGSDALADRPRTAIRTAIAEGLDAPSS